jgi:hypothetical protein
VSDALRSDADGLPLFPPLPGGRTMQQTGARSVARLMLGLRTAVVTVRAEDVAAMVVIVDHQPVDGVAVRGERRVVGPDALDEIAEAPVDRVQVTEVTAEVASVVGSYFLPTELRGVPAGFVAPDDFVRSLARPGQRGCLLVRSDDGLGVVFMAGGRVVLAYREDGPIGGFEQVAPLFARPGATLWARLGPDLSGPMPPPVPEPAPAPAPAAPHPFVPPPAAPPVAHVPAPAPAANGAGVPDPPTVRPSPAPAPVPPAYSAPPPPAYTAAPPPLPAVPPPAGEPPAGAATGLPPLEIALAEVRDVLGAHSVRVEPILRRADPSLDGVRAAAESLRERRVRLISPATMELLADRVLAALDGRAASTPSR